MTPLQPTSKKPAFQLACLLALTILAVYAQTYRFGMVDWDDNIYVYPVGVTGGLTWPNICWAFTTVLPMQYQPTLWLSFQLDATLWGGTNYGMFHLTNVLLHIATALLLMRLLIYTTGSFWRSFIVAAIFALHPTRVESVAWISERKDVLSGAIGVAALLAYAHYARKPDVKRMIGVVLLVIAGLFAKPILVTWPAVMLLMDFWPLKRIGHVDSPAALTSDAAPPTFAPASAARLLLEKLPLVLVVIGAAVGTYVTQGPSSGFGDNAPLSVAERLANIPVAYCRYLFMTLWPVDLAAFYPPVAWRAWQVAASCILLAVITAIAAMNWRARPYLIVGWLWFLGTLVPVIGIIQNGIQSITDRYLYVPHMGLLMAMVWGVADVHAVAQARRAASAMCVVVLLAFGLGSYRQSLYWRNPETLWTHSLKVVDSFVARLSLSHEYARQGRDFLAAEQMIGAARVAPRDAPTQYKAGMICLETGRLREAIGFLRTARNNKMNEPALFEPQIQLIRALRGAGETREADAVSEALVRNAAVPHLSAGAASAAVGDVSGAIAHYRVHLAVNPSDAVAHNALGIALASMGDLPGAIEHFSTAVKLKPDMADAQANLEHARELKGSAKPGVNTR